MKKYKTDFKLKMVKRFLAGDSGAKLLARQWSVPEEKIRIWISQRRAALLVGCISLQICPMPRPSCLIFVSRTIVQMKNAIHCSWPEPCCAS